MKTHVALTFSLLAAQLHFALAGDTPREGPTADRIPAELNAQDNIVYKTVDGRELELVFFPAEKVSEAKTPLVIFIHGGGWGRGNRYGVTLRNVFPAIRMLLKAGVSCASIEYRLAERSGPTVMNAAADCMDAVRYFVRESEKYSIDPGRIALFGASAGGHLALVTGLGKRSNYPVDPQFDQFEPSILAIAAFFPLVSAVDPAMRVGSNFENPRRFEPFLGGPLEEKLKEAELLSPTLLLDANSPPIFLAHGDNDEVLNVVNTIEFEKLAKGKGASVEALIVEGAGHGFAGQTINPSLDEVLRRTAQFLIDRLKTQDQGGEM